MLNNIIAIGGLKNSGKDEIANMLNYILSVPKFLQNYNAYTLLKNIKFDSGYKITSFAHPLKRTVAALLNIDINKFNDRDFKENYYIYFPELKITNHPDWNLVISDNKFSKSISNKDLSFLQENYITIRQLLQVFGTECMRAIFGNKLWILSTLREGNKLIISDLRFKVEAEAVKEKGGILIYINRKGCTIGNHISEQEIYELYKNNSFDYVINNNKSLEDLFNNIKIIVNQIKK